MASNDRFQTRVQDVLRNPSVFPPEFGAWVRGQIVRNPLVKVEAFQLPNLDGKHAVGGTGEPAFLNGWVNHGGGDEALSFYKDNEGRVHLQGTIMNGTIGTAVFTLPPSYRPLANLIFPVQSNAALGGVNIQSGGNVVAATGSPTWVSLCGISFRAF